MKSEKPKRIRSVGAVALAVLAVLSIPGIVAITAGCESPGTAGGGRSSSARSSSARSADAERMNGWLHWRGPLHTGVSLEEGLPSTWEPGGENHLWDLELRGRGTPLVSEGRVYVWGYRGELETLDEMLLCLDEQTGEVIWEHHFLDYLSVTTYSRYTIGSPTIDPDTRLLYLQSNSGDAHCFDLDGNLKWTVPMAEAFGRNTYPNGRTGAPTIEDDLVVFRGVTNNWGAHTPPRDRLYAFDKFTGEPVWASTPGQGPPFLKDSCFSMPLPAWWEGRRVLYTGLGSGAIVCVNAWTGEPIWRSQQIIGGINSSVVLHDGNLIAVHGRQNLDTTETGRMLALELPSEERVTGDDLLLLGKEDEAWRLHVSMFTSSPVLVGDRLYQVDHTGELHCIDVTAGEELWHKKLGPQQIHASPLFGDGKLYVPIVNGTFWILEPNDEGAEELAEVQLEGECLGSPAAWNGKVYVHTTERLYCFGKKRNDPENLPEPTEPVVYGEPGPPVALQVVPNDVRLRPGESVDFRVLGIDAKGQRTGEVEGVSWSMAEPPRAAAVAGLDASFEDGRLVAAADAKQSAGSFRAEKGDLVGSARGRIVRSLPVAYDFESMPVETMHPMDGEKYGDPPPTWIMGKIKWDVREREGSKVLAKTTDKLIHHRAITFIGHPDDSDYVMVADMKTDGNRRGAGEVGLIHQRYIISLRGNHDELEVNSNVERYRRSVPFKVRPGTWYRMKTRVDTKADGSGVIRAKVWPRQEDEPAEWTIEAETDHVHTHGSPGLYGLSPQDNFRVYIDNIEIRPATKETGS